MQGSCSPSAVTVLERETAVCLPTAALEDKEDEEVLMIEDTLSNHTDLTDNEPVTYEVQKQFMR